MTTDLEAIPLDADPVVDSPRPDSPVVPPVDQIAEMRRLLAEPKACKDVDTKYLQPGVLKWMLDAYGVPPWVRKLAREVEGG